MKRALIVSLMVLVFGFGGCATVMSGSTQTITLTSQPSGAKVQCGGTMLITPATMEMERNKNHTVIFTKDGYESQQVRIKKSMNPWILGNILIGGIPGIVVDLITGAAADLKPAEVNAVLAKSPEAPVPVRQWPPPEPPPIEKELPSGGIKPEYDSPHLESPSAEQIPSDAGQQIDPKAPYDKEP